MIEITFTLAATPALICAVRDLAGAIHAAANNAQPVPAGEPFGQLMPPGSPAEIREVAEKDGTAENDPSLPSDASSEEGRPETPENAEEPKKRKSCTKKAPPESNAPVAPAIETPAPEPEPAPVIVHLDGEDPLAGKGQTGEILAELTRKAIGDLEELGVDRSEANRRLRAYCARNDIKFPSFPALLQSVGYAEAIVICKGA